MADLKEEEKAKIEGLLEEKPETEVNGKAEAEREEQPPPASMKEIFSVSIRGALLTFLPVADSCFSKYEINKLGL